MYFDVMPKIRVELPTEALFHSRGTFIRDVWLDRGKLVVDPEPHSGPIDFAARVWDGITGALLADRGRLLPSIASRYVVKLDSEPRTVRAEIKIDGCLAYQGNIKVKTGVVK